MGYIQKLIERLDLGGRGRFLAMVLQGRIVDDLHRLVSQHYHLRPANGFCLVPNNSHVFVFYLRYVSTLYLEAADRSSNDG